MWIDDEDDDEGPDERECIVIPQEAIEAAHRAIAACERFEREHDRLPHDEELMVAADVSRSQAETTLDCRAQMLGLAPSPFHRA